jgi:hypothetical protein
MARERNGIMSRLDIAWGKDGLREAVVARRVRRIALLLVGTAAVALGARPADAALVASWNMNAFDPDASLVVSATTGSGVIDCSGMAAGVGVMQGTTLGVQPGEAAGNALAVVGSASNQTFFRIDFTASGLTDLVLGFATRRSSTGFATNRIDYWDGIAWSTVTTFGAGTTAWEWQTHSLAKLGAVGSEPVSLRVVVDGATGSTGSIRFDNILVTGTPVPAPAGSLALLALAGCVTRRRR